MHDVSRPKHGHGDQYVNCTCQDESPAAVWSFRNTNCTQCEAYHHRLFCHIDHSIGTLKLLNVKKGGGNVGLPIVLRSPRCRLLGLNSRIGGAGRRVVAQPRQRHLAGDAWQRVRRLEPEIPALYQTQCSWLMAAATNSGMGGEPYNNVANNPWVFQYNAGFTGTFTLAGFTPAGGFDARDNNGNYQANIFGAGMTPTRGGASFDIGLAGFAGPAVNAQTTAALGTNLEWMQVVLVNANGWNYIKSVFPQAAYFVQGTGANGVPVGSYAFLDNGGNSRFAGGTVMPGASPFYGWGSTTRPGGNISTSVFANKNGLLDTPTLRLYPGHVSPVPVVPGVGPTHEQCDGWRHEHREHLCRRLVGIPGHGTRTKLMDSPELRVRDIRIRSPKSYAQAVRHGCLNQVSGGRPGRISMRALSWCRAKGRSSFQPVPVGITAVRMPSIRFRIGTLILLVLVIAVGILTALALNRGPEMGLGSKERRELAGEIRSFGDPEHIKTKYPFAAIRKYDDGKWIVGVGEDSHGDRNGGTIVVQGSDGKTRVFFGHVCGPDFLQDGLSRSTSAAEFYDLLSKSQFKFTEKNVP